jgi:hypothetical protein
MTTLARPCDNQSAEPHRRRLATKPADDVQPHPSVVLTHGSRVACDHALDEPIRLLA